VRRSTRVDVLVTGALRIGERARARGWKSGANWMSAWTLLLMGVVVEERTHGEKGSMSTALREV
jgi:hypothetical protein